MSMAQVTQVQAQTYPKYIKYTCRWATGLSCAFEPVIEKSEAKINEDAPAGPQFVFDYAVEAQSSYSRTYYRLVLLVKVSSREQERAVEELVRYLTSEDAFEDDGCILNKLREIVGYIGVEGDSEELRYSTDDYSRYITYIVK